MFIFFRFKLRVLEVSQREQAKVLQSLVMSMRSGGHQRNMVSDDEVMKHMQMEMQMQMQQGGVGAGAGVPGNQTRHPNDLIDVSDDDEEDEDDDDESESSSDSEDDDDTDSSSSEDEKEENDENHENTTKKIIFNNGGALDTHAHNIEHLTGDDIKVIELTEPLYPVGGSAHGSKDLNHQHDTNDISDDDDNDDDDEDMSDDDNDNDNDNDNDDEEIGNNTEVKIEELPNHASLSLPLQQQQQQHLETSTIDTTEIKTIFKADKQQQQKQQQQHTDYNTMNAQTLKQHLKTKLSADGTQYNEAAINKLNKKELIKHLTQG
jgi:hypothetical protein